MLAGDGDGSRNRRGERATHADGVVEDGVDAAEECSAERGEAVGDQVVKRVAFIDAANFYAPVAGLFHMDRSGVYSDAQRARRSSAAFTRSSRFAVRGAATRSFKFRAERGEHAADLPSNSRPHRTDAPSGRGSAGDQRLGMAERFQDAFDFFHVGEIVHALGAAAEFAYGLRAAQH